MLCIVCKLDKCEDDFNWRNKQLELRKNHCRVCDRAMRKRSYEKHREKSIASVRERTKGVRAGFQKWKATLNCVVCGEAEEACLDFHHMDPDTKEDGISSMVGSRSNASVIEELNKCVVLCACCHRKVHKYGWETVTGNSEPILLNVDASLVFNGNIPSFQVGVAGSSPA